MTKLINSQIEEIKKLRSKGRTQMQLAIDYNVSLSTIIYHTNELQRDKKKESSKNWFKNLSPEKKKELNKKKKEYWKDYTKNRYKTDEEYRKRMINYQKEYRERKKDE